jgi:hypothetical protein
VVDQDPDGGRQPLPVRPLQQDTSDLRIEFLDGPFLTLKYQA